jgi:hypothetical protein
MAAVMFATLARLISSLRLMHVPKEYEVDKE